MCAALFGLIAVCSTMTLPASAGAGGCVRVEPAALQERRAIEKEVQVAVRRGLDARDAVDRAERGRQFLRDRARRLAQPARQLEGDRHRQVAQRAARRRLDDDRRLIGSAQAEACR